MDYISTIQDMYELRKGIYISKLTLMSQYIEID